jgi:hypothetical protein
MRRSGPAKGTPSRFAQCPVRPTELGSAKNLACRDAGGRAGLETGGVEIARFSILSRDPFTIAGSNGLVGWLSSIASAC